MIAAGDVVAVVAVGAHVEVGAVDLDAIADFGFPAAIVPAEDAVLGALLFEAHPGHALHLVGGLDERLVAVVDGGLAGVVLAVDGGDDAEGVVEVGVDFAVGLAADGAVDGVHEDVAAALEFGEPEFVVHVVRAGGAAADDAGGEAGLFGEGDGFIDAGEIFDGLAAPGFPTFGVGGAAGVGHPAFEADVFCRHDALGEVDGGLAVGDALTGEAGVDGDDEAALGFGGGGGFVHFGEDVGVVDDEHEGGVGLAEVHGPHDVVVAGGLFGPEDAFDAAAGHEFAFGDGGGGDADGAEGHLAFGDIQALVYLHVGTELDGGRLGVVSHGFEVLFKEIDIDDHAGRGEHVLGDVAEIFFGDALLEFLIGECLGVAEGCAGRHGRG